MNRRQKIAQRMGNRIYAGWLADGEKWRVNARKAVKAMAGRLGYSIVAINDPECPWGYTFGLWKTDKFELFFPSLVPADGHAVNALVATMMAPDVRALASDTSKPFYVQMPLQIDGKRVERSVRVKEATGLMRGSLISNMKILLAETDRKQRQDIKIFMALFDDKN